MGLQQGFGTGQFLLERYGDFLGSGDLATAIKAFTSTAARAKETLDWVLRGLGGSAYAPDAPAVPAAVQEDVPMLRAYAVQDCPLNDNGWAAVDREDLELIRKDQADHADLLAFVSAHTDTPEYGALNASDYGTLGDIADNIALLVLNPSSLLPSSFPPSPLPLSSSATWACRSRTGSETRRRPGRSPRSSPPSPTSRTPPSSPAPNTHPVEMPWPVLPTCHSDSHLYARTFQATG